MSAHIFLRRKSNESVPVTPQLQDDMGNQQQQGSTIPDTEVLTSDTNLEGRLEDTSTPYTNKSTHGNA